MQQKKKNEIVIFQTSKGAVEIRRDFYANTLWASQSDIVSLYERDQSVVSRHLKGIFKDGEIDKESNLQKMRIANSDKPVVFYSLDIVLAVGYRINSQQAIEFRKWATVVLRQHTAEDFPLNSNAAELMPICR